MIMDRGWTFNRARGSHRQYSKAGYPIITIPFHSGDLRTATQLSIMRVAGISREEVENRQ